MRRSLVLPGSMLNGLADALPYVSVTRARGTCLRAHPVRPRADVHASNVVHEVHRPPDSDVVVGRHKCIRTVHTRPWQLKRGPEQPACTMGKGDVVSNVHNHRQGSNACHDTRNPRGAKCEFASAITHIGVFVNPSRLQLVNVN